MCKDLKKLCSLYEQFDLYKQTTILEQKMSTLMNHTNHGKFNIEKIIEDGKTLAVKPSEDVLFRVGEY